MTGLPKPRMNRYRASGVRTPIEWRVREVDDALGGPGLAGEAAPDRRACGSSASPSARYSSDRSRDQLVPGGPNAVTGTANRPAKWVR